MDCAALDPSEVGDETLVRLTAWRGPRRGRLWAIVAIWQPWDCHIRVQRHFLTHDRGLDFIFMFVKLKDLKVEWSRKVDCTWHTRADRYGD